MPARMGDFQVELSEMRDLGDLILVHGSLRGHGAWERASFERDYWGLFRCRSGRIVWWHAFQSEAAPSKPPGCRSSASDEKQQSH